MREIKFRGKNADGVWIFGSLIQGLASNSRVGEFTVSFIIPGLPCSTRGDDFWETRMYRVKPETVGQFTGLHDKNGKEIYEGDIIRIKEPNGGYSEAEISFCDKGYFAINHGINDRVIAGFVDKNHIKINGNIYDNPELLEGVKI